MISFLSVFPPFRGGIATFSHYLYHELSKTTEVHAFNYINLYPDLLFPGKTQYSDDFNNEYAFPILHSHNPFNWRKAADKISGEKPDLFIYSHWHPFFAPSNQYIVKRIKDKLPELKIAGILHNVKPHEKFPFQDKFITSLFRKTDYPVLLSEKTFREFNELNLPNRPYKIFHPVYNQPLPEENKSELRKSMNIADDEFVPLFMGLVRKYKGLDILIDALNKLDLTGRKIRPLIAGEFYIKKDEILNRIKKKHRDRYIIIDRFITNEEMGRYLSMADVMILPYRSASQSGILSNAINFHLPVIASNLPGFMEYIHENKTGIFFETGNSDDLKNQISRFQDEGLNLQFQSNIGILRNQLSWEVFCQRLLDLTEY